MSSSFKTFPINSVLVGLDTTELDVALIKYTAMMCKYLPISHVYFIHVAKDLAFPKEIPMEVQQKLATVDDSIKKEIQHEISEYFGKPQGIDIHIEVKEGSPIDKILRFSKIRNIDLIILGRKSNLKGSGILNSAIARNSPCHLLFVPENIGIPKLKTIMLTTDFSEHSKLALDYIFSMQHVKELNVVCNHIYSVPKGYSKIGKSLEEFADIMLNNVQKEFNSFIKPYGEAIPCEFVLDKNDRPEIAMMEAAKKINPDMIVIGSKGRTNLATVFMGSVAEKLTINDADIPLLIVKNKGENMGVFEALLNI